MLIPFTRTPRLRFVDTPDGSGGGGDFGFPADTAIADMTIEQQAAYWKFQSKKWEKNAKASAKNEKPADFDEILADAQAHRQGRGDDKSPDDKALAEARATARAEALQQVLPTLVRAEFKARLPEMDDDDLDELLEDIDPVTYVKGEGVDVERVDRVAKRLAPPKVEEPEPSGTPAWNLGHLMGATQEAKPGSGPSIDDIERATFAKYQKSESK